MHSAVRDILRGLSDSPPKEIEWRLRMPIAVFRAAHAQWRHYTKMNVSPVESTVLCNNESDLRKIDDSWHRKRIVDTKRLHVAGSMHAKLSVCVESRACGPSSCDESLWSHKRLRKRWSYVIPDSEWVVEWTDVGKTGELEIEYTGRVTDLLQSSSLGNLQIPLSLAIACTSFLMDARSYSSVGTGLPFVRGMRHELTIGHRRHRFVLDCMRKLQPCSLSEMPVRRPIKCCISLKYDGIRAVLAFKIIDGLPCCWMIDRRGRAWSIPTTSCAKPCSIDGEYMEDEGVFQAFDVLEIDGVPLTTSSYEKRLEALRSLELPACLPFDIKVKQFWPPSHTTELLEGSKADNVDGIIVHDLKKPITAAPSMFKWKARHTVDLLVHENGTLMTREMPFDAQVCGDTPPVGQIWEFYFNADGKLVPERRRDDKTAPNAHRVCEEIRRAHEAALTVPKVIDMFA